MLFDLWIMVNCLVVGLYVVDENIKDIMIERWVLCIVLLNVEMCIVNVNRNWGFYVVFFFFVCCVLRCVL